VGRGQNDIFGGVVVVKPIPWTKRQTTPKKEQRRGRSEWGEVKILPRSMQRAGDGYEQESEGDKRPYRGACYETIRRGDKERRAGATVQTLGNYIAQKTTGRKKARKR